MLIVTLTPVLLSLLPKYNKFFNNYVFLLLVIRFVFFYFQLKGLDISWCLQSDIGLPAPDIIYFLKLSPEEASKRGEFGAERYEQKEFQCKVAEEFKKLQELYKADNWKVPLLLSFLFFVFCFLINKFFFIRF